MARDLFIRTGTTIRSTCFALYLKPGANEPAVRQTILDALRIAAAAVRADQSGAARYVTRLTDQWFGLTYVQIAVAVLVAILGIVNALTVSITDRRRELGVLRAVGGLRRQIRAHDMDGGAGDRDLSGWCWGSRWARFSFTTAWRSRGGI